ELWKSNGADAETAMIKEINTTNGSSQPAGLTNVNGTLFFTAIETYQLRLWKSDGTAAGTVLVKDTDIWWDNLTNVNDTLFFASLLDLWKSDGTPAGTTLLRTMDYNNFGGNPEPSVSNLTSVNGTLFFKGYSAGSGYELWKSDGTTAGTTLVKDIFPGGDDYSGYPWSSSPSNLTNVNGTLFFT